MEMEKELQKRWGQILKQEVLVLEKRSNVEKLRNKQVQKTNSDRCQSKLGGWRNLYGIQKSLDAVNRPADQKFDARIYSRIDYDTWERGEMRAWYNSYAVPIPRESVDHVSTKYMIKTQPQKLDPSHMIRRASSHQFANNGPRRKASGGGPHFMDFESNLREQKEVRCSVCLRPWGMRRSNPPFCLLNACPGVNAVPRCAKKLPAACDRRCAARAWFPACAVEGPPGRVAL